TFFLPRAVSSHPMPQQALRMRYRVRRFTRSVQNARNPVLARVTSMPSAVPGLPRRSPFRRTSRSGNALREAGGGPPQRCAVFLRVSLQPFARDVPFGRDLQATGRWDNNVNVRWKHAAYPVVEGTDQGPVDGLVGCVAGLDAGCVRLHSLPADHGA